MSPLAAALLAGLGVALAVRAFPGGFDWQYQVVSALASTRQNPRGGAWFSLGLATALLALWPVTTRLRHLLPRDGFTRVGVAALRTGLVFGVLTGLERLPALDATGVADRLHELLALLSFVALYIGIVALGLEGLRAPGGRGRAVLMLAAFTLLGGMLLFLWLGQRELGWVGRDWRAMGVPLWRSFAFWQWLACVGVWLAFAVFAWAWPVGRAPERR